jgi:fucose permease
LAQGAFSNAINALMLDLSSLRHGKALNSLHGWYSLGAMASPYLIQWGLGPGMHWRTVLFAAGCVFLIFGMVSLCLPYPSMSGAEAPSRRFQWALLGNSLFAMLFAIAFLYNGLAGSLLGWIKELLLRMGERPELSTGVLSLFYLGLAAGRFACASFAERLGYGRTLMLCIAGTVLAYPMATFGRHPFWIASGVLLCGLSLSGLYPVAMAYGTRLFPAAAGTVIGTMSGALTLGSSLPPWWTGMIGGAWNLSAALRLNYLMVVPLIGIGIYLLREPGREQAPPYQTSTR